MITKILLFIGRPRSITFAFVPYQLVNSETPRRLRLHITRCMSTELNIHVCMRLIHKPIPFSSYCSHSIHIRKTTVVVQYSSIPSYLIYWCIRWLDGRIRCRRDYLRQANRYQSPIGKGEWRNKYIFSCCHECNAIKLLWAGHFKFTQQTMQTMLQLTAVNLIRLSRWLVYLL